VTQAEQRQEILWAAGQTWVAYREGETGNTAHQSCGGMCFTGWESIERAG
jgi:hypothetical protein